jgi:hypothetical protein
MANRNVRKSGKNRREQTPKGMGNSAYMRGMQEIRSSGAAGPHKSPTDYRRKPKHVKKGWDA